MRQKIENIFASILTALNQKDQVTLAKQHLVKSMPFWTAAIIAAACSIGYANAVAYFEHLSMQLITIAHYWSLLIIPTLFLLSWWVVDRFAPYASGSGIPQLMAGAEISANNIDERKIINKLLSKHVIVVKIISSLLAVLGGGAIGREGPTLQVASSIFKQVEKWFTKHHYFVNLHGMLLAGGAAGLAAAFNTPMGGIAYAIEELSKSHLSTFKTGILHAVVIAGIATQLTSGSYLYLGYPKIPNFDIDHFLFLILISILIGLVVTIFSAILKKIVIFRSSLKSRSQKALVAGLSGLIFAAFGIFVSHTIFGSGKELLNQMLFEHHKTDFIDVLSRFVGTIFTYSAGGAGGIFAPILAIGGSCAAYFDQLFEVNLGSLTVLVGMVAALSALTRSPLTSFILIVEMTDRHSAILPLMIASLFGSGVSKLIAQDSFYEFVCKRILDEELPKTPIEKV